MIENDFINSEFKISLKLSYAQVIESDTDETTKSNAVKIKILGVHDGFEDAHLPFASPLSNFFGSTENSGVVQMPLVDSFIWVANLGGRWYYVFNANQQTSNLASKYFDEIQDSLGELDQITAPDLEYPNAISFFYESGICVTYSTNSDKPIYSIYHPEGSYCIIDTDGNIGAYSVVNVEIKTENGVQFYTDDENTHFEDGNGNMIDTDDSGIVIEDMNGNKWASDDQGIEAEDLNGNKQTMSTTGVDIEDLNGNTISMTTAMIDFNNGNHQILQ